MNFQKKLFLYILSINAIALTLLLISILNTINSDNKSEIQKDIFDRQMLLSELIQKNQLTQNSLYYFKYIKPGDWIESYLFDNENRLILQNSADINPEYLEIAKKFSTLKTNLRKKLIVKYDENYGLYFSIYYLANQHKLISFVPKDRINRHQSFIALSVLSSLLIIALALFFIIKRASYELSRRLIAIADDITNYSVGDPLFKIVDQGQDEIGKIAGQFNALVNRIDQFIKIEKQAILFEEELKTAQRIQKYFLPENTYSNHFCEIQSYYKSASQCSGDWYYIKEQKGKIFLMIGDVTGHGSGSAFLTSSCCSIINLMFNTYSSLTPDFLMTQLNKGIFENSKGDLNMTMLILSFDNETKQVTYCNASHEPAFLWKNSATDKTDEIMILDQKHGPRLGEVRDHLYTKNDLLVEQKFSLFMYTDGLFEIQKNSKKKLNDKALYNLIYKEHLDSDPLHLKDTILAYIKNDENYNSLKDDISLMIAKFNEKNEK